MSRDCISRRRFLGQLAVAVPAGSAILSQRAAAQELPKLSTDDPAAIALQYVDSSGWTAVEYPQNPNGSPEGITGMCNTDGRVTIMMPHPERTLRTVNFSWAPDEWPETSPWQRMFFNARNWVD